MGLESGTYIDSLVSTNPLGSDNRSQGDDHIRLIKSTVKASFPDVDEAVVTIHNGTSAPSTPQTGTVWRDTTNSLWKFYNGSTWITLPFAFNTSNSVDINAGTIDGVTIGGSSAPTVTNLGTVTTCDINGGTIDGVTIGGSVAPTVTNLGTVTTCDINGGTIDGVTIGTNSVCTDLRVDNIKVDGNAITSTNTNGDLTITPNGTGEIVLDGQKWPQADGSNTNYLTTNGSGQLAWTTNTVPTSEANAATSATNAATSATAAETAKTGAETAKTGAETAQTAAETALDTFDDRMLGTFASDPTVDNDGNTLLDGAMYFNTTNNYMKVYDLGNTTWYQLTNTTSDQNNINTVAGEISPTNNISAVAGKATEIGRLGTADAVADMALLGTADCVSDMNTLATADVVSDLNTLATADVVSDMNTLATSANVTAMSNCSGSIANINTTATNIADVNNFANVYRIASSDPTTSLNTGDMVFNTTSNKTRVYNGSAWQDVSPTSTTNAFSTVAVSGQSNVVADSTTDTLNFVGTGGTTITTTAGTDTITIDTPTAGVSAGFSIAMSIAL